MEIVFYNSLMNPKTVFGMPLYYLKLVTIVISFSIYICPLKISLILSGVLLLGGFFIFQMIKDKLLLEIIAYNLGVPKKTGF